MICTTTSTESVYQASRNSSSTLSQTTLLRSTTDLVFATGFKPSVPAHQHQHCHRPHDSLRLHHHCPHFPCLYPHPPHLPHLPHLAHAPVSSSASASHPIPYFFAPALLLLHLTSNAKHYLSARNTFPCDNKQLDCGLEEGTASPVQREASQVERKKSGWRRGVSVCGSEGHCEVDDVCEELEGRLSVLNTLARFQCHVRIGNRWYM
jgi:hypothetical protein